jgi:hypothetical protein
MMESRFPALVFSQIVYLPFLLVYVAGIILSLVRWSIHPRVSILSITAFSILLLCLITNMGLTFWLIGGQSSGLDMARRAMFLQWVHLTMACFNFIGWVLLLIALFGWRRTQE